MRTGEEATLENTAAIVLSGGRSARMGRPKHALVRDGVTLLEIALSACPGARPVVLVGPVSLRAELNGPPQPEHLVVTREDPPGGGPCAGLAAGIERVPAGVEWVQLLTCDLPRAPEVVAALAAVEPPHGAAAVVATDSSGWPQLLCGRYRAAPLRAALAGEVRDRSARRVLGDLVRQEIPLEDVLLADVDDPDAARRVGFSPPGGW